MTEEEWLACKDPRAMLKFLKGGGRLTDRKARLFAVACCRRVWHLLDDERSRRAVEVAERHADGLATDEELEFARDATGFWKRTSTTGRREHAVLARVTGELPSFVAEHNLRFPPSERQTQADLLQDIFGPLPFRSVALDPAWLTWHDGLVVRLALAAYEDRIMPAGTLDNVRLAVLADALEEAGCTDAEILRHLRGPGPHVRGCHLLDWVLGRGC